MNRDVTRSSAVLFWVCLTAFLGAGALLTPSRTPLHPSANAGERGTSSKIVARLWEDPLEAVNAAPDAPAPASASDARPPANPLAARISKTAQNWRILILPIPETRFPSDHEYRLRQRYTLQMALGSEGFVPETPNYLEYFTQTAPDEAGGPSHRVPFEIYHCQNSNNTAPNALILWEPEDLLAGSPLKSLGRLAQDLRGGQNTKDDRHYYFIGPTSSDGLKSLVEDITGRNAGTILPGVGERLSFFSPRATASDTLIGLTPSVEWRLARSGIDPILHESNAAAANRTHIDFSNFIGTDDQLTDILVNELSLRGFSYKVPDSEAEEFDKMLILTEADTTYGRALPNGMEASIISHRSGLTTLAYGASHTPWEVSNLASPGDRVEDKQLLVYHYLSGLDLQKGAASDPARTAAATPQNVEGFLFRLFQHRSSYESDPVGESQLDYTERLADQIERSTSAKNIKAVGVFGGDVHDKLILLKSLRHRFPEAIFFTTDLDARLWSQEWIKTTRNMVVASSYDVEMHGDGLHRLNMPAFRDNYQVAAFRACSAALRQGMGDGPTNGFRMPAVFEIGSRGPVALPLPVSEAMRDFVAVSPARRSPLAFAFAVLAWNLVILGVAMLALDAARYYNSKASWLGFLLGGRRTPGKRRSGVLPRRKPLHYWIGASVVLLSLAVVAGKLWLVDIPNGEPWAWALGVSVWPVEMIRLVNICIVIGCGFWAWEHHLLGNRTLRKKFRFVDDYQSAELVSTPDANRAFGDYVQRARRSMRAKRVALHLVAYLFLFASLAFLVDGILPNTPYIRGTLARRVDAGVLLASYVLMLGLVLYVLDAVLLTTKLLHRFPGKQTKWPDACSVACAAEYGVSANDVCGLLDVRFAAMKSSDTGALILLPLIVHALFFVSELPYFDNSRRSLALNGILAVNLGLIFVSWLLMRGVAGTLQTEALESMDRAIFEVRLSLPAAATPGSQKSRERLRGLRQIRNDIAAETRGAYAPAFRDPRLLIMFIPGSVYTMIFILAESVLG